jgi:hypothetical protein
LEWYHQDKKHTTQLKTSIIIYERYLIFTRNRIIETQISGAEGAIQCLNLIYKAPTYLLFHLCLNFCNDGERSKADNLFHHQKAYSVPNTIVGAWQEVSHLIFTKTL